VPLVTEYLSPNGPYGEHGVGSLTRESEGRMNFQGKGCTCRMFCRRMCLYVGVRIQGTVRDSGRRAPEMVHLSLREFCGGIWSVKKALEMGISFRGGRAEKPGRKLICRELMCGRRFWDGCLSI
jgi:hypothetical protein